MKLTKRDIRICIYVFLAIICLLFINFRYSPLFQNSLSLLGANSSGIVDPEAFYFKKFIGNKEKKLFQQYSYDSNNKYIQVIKPKLNQDDYKSGFALLLEDLNDDGQDDILALPVKESILGTTIFRSPDYKEINMIKFPVEPEKPVYIMDSRTEGMKDIVINDKYICKFSNLCSHFNLKQVVKNSQKVVLKEYQKNTGDKYFQKIDQWVKNRTDNEENYKNKMRFGLAYTLVDLNNDGIEDILAVPALAEWCGFSSASGCGVKVFIGPDYKSNYEIATHVFIRRPLYVLKSTTKGLNNIFINDKFICKFDGYQRYLCD